MPEAPFDLAAKHPLLPHPQVTKLYQENDFKYNKTLQDRNYDAWYDEVKRSNISILITQFFRTQRTGKKDYLYYDAILFGTDRKGNRTPFTMRFGTYERPTFYKAVDQRTDKVESQQVEEKITTYDIPYTDKLFDELLEQASDDRLNLVVVTPGRTYNINDPIDFRDATHTELIEMGTTGRSLHSLRTATPPKQTATKSH